MKTKIERRDEFAITALRQVWEWKDAIYQETKHLSTGEGMRYIHEQAGGNVRQLNLRGDSFQETEAHVPDMLAETPPPYGTKKQ